MRRSHASVAAGILLLILLGVAQGPARAQALPPFPLSSNPAPASPQTIDQQRAAAERSAQADLDRVKSGLQGLPPVRFDVHEVRFYATARAQTPITFEDLVGSFDLTTGPTPYAGMTHNEFMNMSRPKDLFSTTGITPRDMAQAALVNIAAQRAIRAITDGIQALKRAKTNREIKAIQAQIDRELAALAAMKKKGKDH